jgi:tetratricopeptide (TPR) repeat protein
MKTAPNLVVSLFWLIVFGVLATPPRGEAAEPPTAAEVQKEVQELRKQVEADKQLIERRLDSESSAVNRQLDSVSKSTEWTFRIMAGIAVVGSLFGIGSWFKSTLDYQQERRFYEARINKIDDDQRQLTGQQVSIGANLVSHSEEMLVKQIQSIGGLGNVIDLVRRTFEIQLARQQEMELVTDLRTHFDEVYRSVSDGMLTFAEHSRMAWTQLSPYEESLSAAARSDFRTIPEVVLKRQEEKDRYGYARVLQLLGVAAFYANDVDAAGRYLIRAKDIFRKNEARQQDLYPHAFCSHFLGLISKNWLREGRFIEATLTEAKSHLQDAMGLIGDIPGEFLTPLTLAEILSYSEIDQEAARLLLDKKLQELEDLKATSDGLNDNQHKLLGRAYLMRGNLEFTTENFPGALEWYEKANRHHVNDYAAQLSIGLAASTIDPTRSKEQFAQGLKVLESSEAFNKREVSTRAIAISWAIVASTRLGENSKRARYQKALEALKAEIRGAGGRQPLFFCPTTKSLCTFDKLKQSLTSFVNGSAKAATQGVG